jgi:predicted phosphoadenosine phosphosulfate sulfurtransferase
MDKHPLGIDVLTAARERIAWLFDNIPNIYVSFSGGKDSTVLLHLALEQAIQRRRKIGVLFVDLEAQYAMTITHISALYAAYADWIEPYWVALPLNLRNAVSQFEPQWMCWDPERRADWVRPLPPQAISDEGFFPFFRRRMEFEAFVADFGHWYSRGKLTACLVGIRTDESLNRWRTIMAGRKSSLEGKTWTTWLGGHLYNAYPIYDWKTRDIWIYHGRHPDQAYNPLYDRMRQAGLSMHQMRICQPYGDDQRKGLWLFHVIEPETWARVVARVNGANQGALYARERGNILGNLKISKPEGSSWQQFALLLLESMPEYIREHYKNKIAVFLNWYAEKRGYTDGIPDDGSLDKGYPSWKRICKVLLRNDYWCKGLSFSPTKPEAYQRYLKIMKKRRQQWRYE